MLYLTLESVSYLEITLSLLCYTAVSKYYASLLENADLSFSTSQL